jgi:hypothetical protein
VVAAYQAILNDAAGASFMACAEQVGGAVLVHQCAEYAYKAVFVMSGLENVYFQALHGIALEGIDGILFKAVRDHREGFKGQNMYHRSKYTSVMLLGTSLTVILLLPLEFRPSFILPLLAVCVGILGRIQWKYFKKYL